MTSAPGRATGTWARCGGILSYRTSGGTVVLPLSGRTAMTLSGVEDVLWTAAAEPTPADALVALAGDSAPAALAELAGLGLMCEVA